MITLTEAIIFATQAHDGQEYGKFNGNPTPYIFHPLRVMLSLPKRSQIVGVLHDVLEDCEGITLPELSETHREALRLLTRDPMVQTYEQYIECLREAPGEAGIIAREVKKADLLENIDHNPPKKLKDRYWIAWYRLS